MHRTRYKGRCNERCGWRFGWAAAFALGLALLCACERRDIRVPRAPGVGEEFARELNAGVELLAVRRPSVSGPATAVARVRWTNRSGERFEQVEVRCFAIAADGRLSGMASRSLSASEGRRIRPGFSGRVDVPIPLSDRRLARVSCSIAGVG